MKDEVRSQKFYPSFKTVLCMVLFSFNANAATLAGRVVGVSDGDTITVLNSSRESFKIRLLGIDAPEKKQGFGGAAKKHLSDLVFGKQVKVEYEKKDRYGRILGKIKVGTQDINLEQIKKGLAWYYAQYAKDQPIEDRSKYSEAEEKAKKAKIGLWGDPTQIPPWEFRRSRKTSPSLALSQKSYSSDSSEALE